MKILTEMTCEFGNAILMMSLLPFWVLNVVVPLLFMEGQEALWFGKKNILIRDLKMNEGLTGFERKEGE